MPDYTILVIDYDPRSIEAIRAPLERAGHRVEVAGDGIRGLEAFRELRPHLTLIEFMIPKKSGLEVCQELRSSPEGQAARLVIMSSRFRSRHYRTEAKHKYRADAFIEKPVAEDELLALLDRLVPESADRPPAATAAPAASPAAPRVVPSNGNTEAIPAAFDPVPAGTPTELEAEVVDRLDSVLGDL